MCVCVCVCNRWGCNGAVFLHSCMPCKGTLDGGYWGDYLGLVLDFQVRGMLYVIFSPLCSPLHHSEPPPLFIPGYTITAHKGLSSQVQPRLARIKERFQHKMFFSHFFKQLLPSFFLYSFLFSCHPIISFTHTSALLTHFLHFLPKKSLVIYQIWLFKIYYYFFMVAQVFFSGLMESRFKKGRIWLAAVSWLRPEKNGRITHLLESWRCVCFKLCEKVSQPLSYTVSLIFGGTALAAGPDAEGRGRNGGREGAKGRM